MSAVNRICPPGPGLREARGGHTGSWERPEHREPEAHPEIKLELVFQRLFQAKGVDAAPERGSGLHEAPWNVGSIFFFGVSVGAATMQGIADYQMHRFQKHKTGVFIRGGLWKNSRHPNYLGEILMWWGVAFSVISVFPRVWYLVAGALANTVLFLAASIPLADGRQSRKPGFEEYKSQTRMLLPLKR